MYYSPYDCAQGIPLASRNVLVRQSGARYDPVFAAMKLETDR